jgi:hypothetical protein
MKITVYMTFAIGEYLLGCVDLFLLIPVSVLACTQVVRASNRATWADLEKHCQDFPHSPLACLRPQTSPRPTSQSWRGCS